MPLLKIFRGGSSDKDGGVVVSSETNNNKTKGGGIRGLFRSHKSESSISFKKERNDGTNRTLSEASRSTLSMSLASNGCVSSNWGTTIDERSAAFRAGLNFSSSLSSSHPHLVARKSQILQESPLDKSEHVPEEESEEPTVATPQTTTATKLLPHADTTSTVTTTAPSEIPSNVTPQSPPAYLLKPNEEHPELGYLQNYYTDMAKASEYAQSEGGKPILALFTEFPGDDELGDEIFAHPLIVEAIQTLFVLVVQQVPPANPMRRTPSGRRCRTEITLMEANTLESLIGESLWGGALTRQSLVQAMTEALEKAGKFVPKYLQVLDEGDGCRQFVVGSRLPSRSEVEFANVKGVMAAQSAFWNRQRVCIVWYDPRQVSYSALFRYALQHSLCDCVYYRNNEERMVAHMELTRSTTGNVTLPAMFPLECQNAKWEDDLSSKQALRSTPMRFVPLTSRQSLLANQFAHQGRFNEAMRILSPWQGQILMAAMRNSTALCDLINIPIQIAWRSVCEQKPPIELLKKDRCNS